MRHDVAAGAEATLILRNGDKETEVRLYSPEGVALLDALRLKQAAQFKHMYEPHWLGVRIIQLPEDIVAMQELIWAVRPDLVIECGVAHGGSLILHASLLELLGAGHVLGIDVDIRPPNRAILEAHPLAHRIELLQGSSIDPNVAAEVRRRSEAAKRVLVVLDSNHSKDHVREEIRLYHSLVTAGSYLVVMDGAQALVSDIPRGDPDWAKNNPLLAIEEFLEETDAFVADPHYERFGATCVPRGFLRRLASGPAHA